MRGAGGVKADSRAFGLSRGSMDWSSVDVGKAVARMLLLVVAAENLWGFGVFFKRRCELRYRLDPCPVA